MIAAVEAFADPKRRSLLDQLSKQHGSISRRRGLVGLLCALGAILILPASASAAPSAVGIDSSQLNVGAGEDQTPHDIKIAYSGGTYLVTDAAGLAPTAPCTMLSSTSASCPSGDVTFGVAVDGSPADDRITIASVGPEIPLPGRTIAESSGGTGVFGKGGNDTITTPGTFDLISGGDGNDTMDGGLGPDQMIGGKGQDTVSYANRTGPVTVVMGADVPEGAPGEYDVSEVENVIGGSGNDTFVGTRAVQGILSSKNGFNNTFVGGDGNDRLVGAVGADRLIGGPGKDTLLGGSGRDRCIGGPGKDRAKGCERRKSI